MVVAVYGVYCSLAKRRLELFCGYKLVCSQPTLCINIGATCSAATVALLHAPSKHEG